MSDITTVSKTLNVFKRKAMVLNLKLFEIVLASYS